MARTTMWTAAVLSSVTVLSLGEGVLAQTPAPQGGTGQAPTVNNAVGVRRNTTSAGLNLGEFPSENAQPQPVARPTLPRGEVGGTGAVTQEHAPAGDIRGSTGPAPGDIDMTQPIGPADVVRLMRIHEPQLHECYTQARARRPTLAGRVNVRFTIGRRGEVQNPEATGLPEAPEVATCVRDRLALLRFPRPESGVLPYSQNLSFVPAPPTPARGRGRAPRTPPRR